MGNTVLRAQIPTQASKSPKHKKEGYLLKLLPTSKQLRRYYAVLTDSELLLFLTESREHFVEGINLELFHRVEVTRPLDPRTKFTRFTLLPWPATATSTDCEPHWDCEEAEGHGAVMFMSDHYSEWTQSIADTMQMDVQVVAETRTPSASVAPAIAPAASPSFSSSSSTFSTLSMEMDVTPQRIRSEKVRMERLEADNLALRQLVLSQRAQIEECRRDKERFAAGMMAEMDRLRDELKHIGRRQCTESRISEISARETSPKPILRMEKLRTRSLSALW